MPTFDVFKKLHLELYSDLKKVSKDPDVLKFVAAFFRFFAVIAIEFFSLVMLATVIYAFVISPFVKDTAVPRTGWQKMPSNTNKGGMHFYNKLSDLDKRVTYLESIVGNRPVAEPDRQNATDEPKIEDTFSLNNNDEYIFQTPNFELKLTNTQGYTYSLSLCSKKTPSDCFMIINQPEFVFSNTDVIQSLQAKAYQIAGVESYVFAGSVKTNNGNFPFILYPQAVLGSTYKSVERIYTVPSTLQFVEDIVQPYTGLRFKAEYQDSTTYSDIDVYLETGSTELKSTVYSY